MDIRVIAATHRSLKQEIDEGRFREDLFYRLNVVKMQLPPLKQRPEDAAVIEARMYPETLILRSHESVHDMLRDLVVGHEKSAPFTDFRDQMPVAAENAQRNLQRNITDCLRCRQARGYVVVGSDHRCHPANRRRNPQSDNNNQRAQHPASGFVTRVVVGFFRALHSRWRSFRRFFGQKPRNWRHLACILNKCGGVRLV